MDASSSNLNAAWNDGTFPRFYLDTLHALTGKPIIVSEFYMAAQENRSGNRNSRSDFPTASYEVAAGDRLVFLTDGLVEASDPSGEPFGFERLEALLRAEASADAARLRETVLAAVSAHTHGAPPDDDRTLLIVTLKAVEDEGGRT